MHLNEPRNENSSHPVGEIGLILTSIGHRGLVLSFSIYHVLCALSCDQGDLLWVIQVLQVTLCHMLADTDLV